jgi:hypothetical protein
MAMARALFALGLTYSSTFGFTDGMPRKRLNNGKARLVAEAKAWVIEVASKSAKFVGVEAGPQGRRGGEAWTLAAVQRYARARGPLALARIGTDTLRGWLSAPGIRERVKLWAAEPKRVKEAKPKGLPAKAKEQLAARKLINGFAHRCGNDEAAAPKVTLPAIYFATRPEIPPSDRERLGKDFRAPSAREQLKLTEDQVLAEGEAALRRIRGSAPMKDWLAIGRALLVLRKKAMVETGAKKPRGLPYVTRNSALLRQHGFLVISRLSRQTAMLVVENLPAIEKWLAKLPDERRLCLNHPMVVWRSYLADKKRGGEGEKWRDRKMLAEEDFARLVQAMAESLDSRDPVRLAVAAAQALGYAIPRRVFCGQHDYVRRPQPVMPWSPFELSLA